MDELDVCRLTVKFHATPRGKRTRVARDLLKATGERHLGTALQIGQDMVKRSKHPAIVEYRRERHETNVRTMKRAQQARNYARLQDHRMLNDI